MATIELYDDPDSSEPDYISLAENVHYAVGVAHDHVVVDGNGVDVVDVEKQHDDCRDVAEVRTNE